MDRKYKNLLKKDEEKFIKRVLVGWSIGFIVVMFGFLYSDYISWTNGILAGGFLLISYLLTLQIIIKMVDMLINLKLVSQNIRNEKK